PRTCTRKAAKQKQIQHGVKENWNLVNKGKRGMIMLAGDTMPIEDNVCFQLYRREDEFKSAHNIYHGYAKYWPRKSDAQPENLKPSLAEQERPSPPGLSSASLCDYRV
ncbi:hypothetical protein U0070_020648, partial [Myodes glareolus]